VNVGLLKDKQKKKNCSECGAFKGQTEEKNESSKNENVKINV